VRARGDYQQSVCTAYRENLSLQVAGVRVLEARAQLSIVIGELYPQTQQAFGSVQRIRPSETTSQATFSRILAYSESQIGLSASWELDFWGRFRRAIESADASLLSAVANYDNTLVSLTADVATNYITIRTLEKRRRNVDTQKESLRIAEARFAGGTTSQRDVEQANGATATSQQACYS
jgi:outer membrane protein TolC